MEVVSVICPTCFESFEVATPPVVEVPAQLDYDCEVCCHPMVILVERGEGSEITAEARGLGD